MHGGKSTILIVDDEEHIRALLRDRLEEQGYRCEEVTNAFDVFPYLNDSNLDLILLDIKLPGMSGMDLLPQVKYHRPDLIVVMVTGLHDMDIAIEALRQGAYDFVTKPFHLDDVFRSVKRGMEKRNLELQILDYQQNLEQKVKEQEGVIRKDFLGAVAALSFALESKDSYTAGHSRRVTDVAIAIGRRMNLGQDELDQLHWGGLLHDIGKIAVNPLIINKPDKLTKEEYEHVMTHPIVGASVIRPIVRSEAIVEIVEHHHARYDGSGLRQRLHGKGIPLLARITSLADAYDAMTSERPYRCALTREEALAEIRREIGGQFDPGVAKAFLSLQECEITPDKERILIADDEEGIRLLVRSILSTDYEVIEATDGQEAVRLTAAARPALVLMDILMPTKDGLEACYEIKKSLLTKDIPVVMLTALHQELNRRLSGNLGADAYITKPFSSDLLIETVRRLTAGVSNPSDIAISASKKTR